jgi:hypothetical protein
MKTRRADDYISAILESRNKELGDQLESDVVAIKSPIRFGLDAVIRHELENLHEDLEESKRRRRLCVVIETTGGQIEAVERIYNVFRKHYDFVSFVVPSFAYSAGTVLVLSGDEIYMDYFSVLGPIDPQYLSEDGRWVPGLGYLHKYEELVDVINTAAEPGTVRAQLSYLLKKFDPATLFLLEQARTHSISLLEEWLPRHKFKSWKITRSSGKKVTPAMRRERARMIAKTLGDATRWHSHGRGIGIHELTSEEIKLDIVNFGDDPKLNSCVRNYYHLFADYCSKLASGGPNDPVIHSLNGLRRF